MGIYFIIKTNPLFYFIDRITLSAISARQHQKVKRWS